MAGRTRRHINRKLLELVAAGDEPSFRILYDHFSPAIYRTAFRYLRVTQLAEDIVQDIFLTLWTNRKDIGRIESLENYIFILARNQCFRLLKKKATLANSEEAFFSELSDDSWEENEAQYTLIAEAIEQLPPQQKKIFEMAKLHGLSHQTISEALDLSPSTVNNHITAAFRSVRSFLRQRASEALSFLL